MSRVTITAAIVLVACGGSRRPADDGSSVTTVIRADEPDPLAAFSAVPVAAKPIPTNVLPVGTGDAPVDVPPAQAATQGFDWQGPWNGLRPQLTRCLDLVPIRVAARISCAVVLRGDGGVAGIEVTRFELRAEGPDGWIVDDARPRVDACVKGRILAQRWPVGNGGKRSPQFDFVHVKQD